MALIEQLAFTPSQAAAAASVSRPTIYRWMRLDGFPVARIGGCTRIPAEAFREWLNRQAGVRENAN
nr:MAG TPA: helix-turn-helix domain protein [Caudoviricetes sp.]